MSIFRFRGGVHPNDKKQQTEHQAIEKIAMPKMLYIPVLQHIGAPLESLVNVGDKVLKGEKIAESSAFLVSPIHAPTSGTIKKIENHYFTLMGEMNTIFLEPDGEDKWCELFPIADWKKATKDELLKQIKNCGVVGLGGASFPTQIKLDPPLDVRIDTLLLNGAECEPYLTSDNRVMLEKTPQMIEGIKILKKILNVENVIIGIEDNKKEAIAKLKEAVLETGIDIKVLKTLYPQGGEKQLIKATLNREVPSGKLPMSVGVVVQNTTTAVAIYEAVVNGTPIIDKVVTVAGNAVKAPKNIQALIGTPISELLDAGDTNREEIDKLIVGGPMMGMAQHTELVPVVKGTSGVLGLTSSETNHCKSRACIGCGKCIEVCPMGLTPIMYPRIAENESWEEMKTYNLMDCIECGCCSYICPSNRPLTESIKLGKTKLREMMCK